MRYLHRHLRIWLTHCHRVQTAFLSFHMWRLEDTIDLDRSRYILFAYLLIRRIAPCKGILFLCGRFVLPERSTWTEPVWFYRCAEWTSMCFNEQEVCNLDLSPWISAGVDMRLKKKTVEVGRRWCPSNWSAVSYVWYTLRSWWHTCCAKVGLRCRFLLCCLFLDEMLSRNSI